MDDKEKLKEQLSKNLLRTNDRPDDLLATGGISINPTTLFDWILKSSLDIDELKKLNKETTEKIEKYEKTFKEQDKLITETNVDIGNLKKDLEAQKNRIPEIVGLFSAIIALLLMDVSVIKSAETFFAAILLIVSLTCSVAIFAVLLHKFFNPTERTKFGWSFWLPISVLVALIVLGAVTFFLRIDLYNIKSRNETTDVIQQINSNTVDVQGVKPNIKNK